MGVHWIQPVIRNLVIEFGRYVMATSWPEPFRTPVANDLTKAAQGRQRRLHETIGIGDIGGW